MNRHINTQLDFNQHEFHWYPMIITQGKTEVVCQELDERGIEYILPSYDVETEEMTSDIICAIDVNHISSFALQNRPYCNTNKKALHTKNCKTSQLRHNKLNIGILHHVVSTYKTT